jgi:hypothetical protein
MIKIDELFEKYPENIIGFRVNKATKIVDVWLNSSWEIPKQPNGINVKKQKLSEDSNLAYYIVYSEIIDFSTLYQSVSNIIEHNLDIERKQNLFTDKLTELKNLFTKLSYDELKAIQFETPYSLRTQENLNETIVEETVENVVTPTAEENINDNTIKEE